MIDFMKAFCKDVRFTDRHADPEVCKSCKQTLACTIAWILRTEGQPRVPDNCLMDLEQLMASQGKTWK